MYVAREVTAQLYQGDIIADFPVVIVPDSELKIVSSEQTDKYPQDAVIDVSANIPDVFKRGQERVIVGAYKSPVMIISQTCDIEHREFITVASVFKLSLITNEDRKKSIASYKVNYRFYLPEHLHIIEPSYVDLTILNSVRKESVDKNDRILSLSDYGRSLLVHHLYGYFCRPIMPT